MVVEREPGAGATSKGFLARACATQYVEAIWRTPASPYFLIATAGTAFPAARSLEIGFYPGRGVIVMTPTLREVVFSPSDAEPS